MSQTQDTVDILGEQIGQWEQASRAFGEWHGRDMFQEAQQALCKRMGDQDCLGRRMPVTHRVLPKKFLVEWAAEIAHARWRISKEWFEREGIPHTLVPVDSRIISAQKAGHDKAVDDAAALARVPYLQQLAMIIGSCGMSIGAMSLLGRRAA